MKDPPRRHRLRIGVGGNLGRIPEDADPFAHPAGAGGELPRSFSALSYRDLTSVFSVVELVPPAPALEPEPPAPAPAPGLMSKLKSKVGKCLGELPRSFSALSYRDLTFVFSKVVGFNH